MYLEDMPTALDMLFMNEAGSITPEYMHCHSDGLSIGGSDASSRGLASSGGLDLSSSSTPSTGSIQAAASQVSHGWTSTLAGILNVQLGGAHSPIRQSCSHAPAAGTAQQHDNAAPGSGMRHISPLCPPHRREPAAPPARMHDMFSADGMHRTSPVRKAVPAHKRQSVSMPGNSLPGDTPAALPRIKTRAATLPGDRSPAAMPALPQQPFTASPPPMDAGQPLIAQLQATITRLRAERNRLRSERNRYATANDSFRKQAVSALYDREALKADRQVLERALIEAESKGLRLEKVLGAERAARVQDRAAAAEATELAIAEQSRRAFANERAQYHQLLNKFVKRIARLESEADEGGKGALQWAALHCEQRLTDKHARCEQRLGCMQEECREMLDYNLAVYNEQLQQQETCLTHMHELHVEQLHAGYLEQLQQQEAQQQQQHQQVASPQLPSGPGPDELDALIKRAVEEGRREAWVEISESYKLTPKAKPSGWKRFKTWVKSKVSSRT